jgi:hypothetical protein
MLKARDLHAAFDGDKLLRTAAIVCLSNTATLANRLGNLGEFALRLRLWYPRGESLEASAERGCWDEIVVFCRNSPGSNSFLLDSSQLSCQKSSGPP